MFGNRYVLGWALVLTSFLIIGPVLEANARGRSGGRSGGSSRSSVRRSSGSSRSSASARRTSSSTTTRRSHGSVRQSTSRRSTSPTTTRRTRSSGATTQVQRGQYGSVRQSPAQQPRRSERPERREDIGERQQDRRDDVRDIGEDRRDDVRDIGEDRRDDIRDFSEERREDVLTYRAISVAGHRYHYRNGLYYRAVYSDGVVVYDPIMAPVGAVIYDLPSVDCTVIMINGVTHWVCHDVYYIRTYVNGDVAYKVVKIL